MTLYYNELAPWERKQEYYHIIELGKDVKKQTEILNQQTKAQTKALISSQIASTNTIIASQDRIAEGIDVVACGVERVEQGIFELKSAFEWGISEVVWQIEQNRAELKNILEVLMRPLDTQAKERKWRAEEAYANGWIDDAEEEFLESENLNKFDFSIHISLGMIYLFKIINKEKALSYFEKAIKYSKPKSSFYTSYALLHKALIHYDMGDIEEAEKASNEAVEFSLNFTEALYQNAQYNAQLLNNEQSFYHLEMAIQADKYYCLKANNDNMFDPIRGDVNKLFEKLRQEEEEKAIKSFEEISEKQDILNSFTTDFFAEPFFEDWQLKDKLKKLNEDFKTLNKMFHRNSYFDFRDINENISPRIKKKQSKLTSDLKQAVENNVEGIDKTLNNISEKTSETKKTYNNEIQEYFGTTNYVILIGSFVVPAVMTLILAPGWDKLLFIVFCIPLLSQGMSLWLLLYVFPTQYSDLSLNDKIFCWTLVLFIIGAVAYYLVNSSSSKSKMEGEVSKQKSMEKQLKTMKELTIPYLERVKKL